MIILDKLYFSITINNHTFKIVSSYNSTLCFYEIKDKYTTILKFAKNTYVSVNYKNICFKGSVTKRNKWHISLDMWPIIQKNFGRYYFNKTIVNEESNSVANEKKDKKTEYPKIVIKVYEKLIMDLSQIYLLICDKDEFQHQMCEYLLDSLDDIDDLNDLNEIIEYENYERVDNEGNPEIIKITRYTELINDCEKLFKCFYQSELDRRNIDSIITLENVIAETPNIHNIPDAYLKDEFESYFNKNRECLIDLDINYVREDVLFTIGEFLNSSYGLFRFKENVKNTINTVLDEKRITCLNKKEMYERFIIKYNSNNIISSKYIKDVVTNYIDEQYKFTNLFNKFYDLFNSNEIQLKWDDSIINLFKTIEKDNLSVPLEYVAEYEVYKFVIPHVKKNLYIKNSTRFKPTIKKLPNLVEYANEVFNVLFKHNVLIDQEECVMYNEKGNIHSASKDLEDLL